MKDPQDNKDAKQEPGHNWGRSLIVGGILSGYGLPALSGLIAGIVQSFALVAGAAASPQPDPLDFLDDEIGIEEILDIEPPEEDPVLTVPSSPAAPKFHP